MSKILSKDQAEESNSDRAVFKIPGKVKASVTIVFLPLALLCLFQFFRYLVNPVGVAPSELGIPGIFLFSITCLFVAWLPWSELGLRVTKIGGVEFELVMNEQAEERDESFGFLEERLDSVENAIRIIEPSVYMTEHFEEPGLRQLLLKFFGEFDNIPCSPKRLSTWGASQVGFEKLSSIDYQFLRSTLQRMVAEGELTTVVSKRGATLYKLA